MNRQQAWNYINRAKVRSNSRTLSSDIFSNNRGHYYIHNIKQKIDDINSHEWTKIATWTVKWANQQQKELWFCTDNSINERKSSVNSNEFRVTSFDKAVSRDRAPRLNDFLRFEYLKLARAESFAKAIGSRQMTNLKTQTLEFGGKRKSKTANWLREYFDFSEPTDKVSMMGLLLPCYYPRAAHVQWAHRFWGNYKGTPTKLAYNDTWTGDTTRDPTGEGNYIYTRKFTIHVQF